MIEGKDVQPVHKIGHFRQRTTKPNSVNALEGDTFDAYEFETDDDDRMFLGTLLAEQYVDIESKQVCSIEREALGLKIARVALRYASCHSLRYFSCLAASRVHLELDIRTLSMNYLLNSATSNAVINHMKSIFAKYGIPQRLVSDNGPQYDCKEFRDFTDSYGIEHITSSPTYPHSNGSSKRAVQTIENVIKRCKESGI